MVDITEEISLHKLSPTEKRTVLKVLAKMEANGIVRIGQDASGNITVKLLSQADSPITEQGDFAGHLQSMRDRDSK